MKDTAHHQGRSLEEMGNRWTNVLVLSKQCNACAVKSQQKEKPYCRISMNNSKECLFLFSHKKGAIVIRGKAIICFIFPLIKKNNHNK